MTFDKLNAHLVRQEGMLKIGLWIPGVRIATVGRPEACAGADRSSERRSAIGYPETRCTDICANSSGNIFNMVSRFSSI